MALPSTTYMLLKGKIALVERDPTTGATTKVLYVGNCPSFKLSLKTEKIEHYESMSGLNQLDRSIPKTIGAEVSITMENIAKEVAKLLVWGTEQTIAAATNRIDTLPSGVANGERYLLSRAGLSNVDSVVDSAGTPATLVNGTDYEIDQTFGSILIKNVGTYVQPFKVQYDTNVSTAVPFFTTDQPVRFIRFEGINKGNPGNSKNHLIELYNCPLEPVSDLDIIGDDLGKFEIKAACQIDETRQSDAALGQFGRLVYI